MGFVVRDDMYRLDEPCRKCGEAEWILCFPGEYPFCETCRSKLLYPGRTPAAACVTPTGLLNQHMKRVEHGPDKNGWVCYFCKQR